VTREAVSGAIRELVQTLAAATQVEVLVLAPELLDACGENEPVVLIGHSLGGPILRAFAAEHPRRVAGL
jgi:pimeloyl-ACP methyl ester carboxylesterase